MNDKILKLFIILLIIMSASHSLSYGAESKRAISFTGGLAYPVRCDDLEYWKNGFSFSAHYYPSMSKSIWLGVEIDISRFGFSPERYLEQWNRDWNVSQSKDHIDGKERWLTSISGRLNVILVEIKKIKLNILGGMSLNILSSSVISVNGEGKSFYSTYVNPGFLTGAGICYDVLPRISVVIETKYHKNILIIPDQIRSAGAAFIKTGIVYVL